MSTTRQQLTNLADLAGRTVKRAVLEHDWAGIVCQDGSYLLINTIGDDDDIWIDCRDAPERSQRIVMGIASPEDIAAHEAQVKRNAEINRQFQETRDRQEWERLRKVFGGGTIDGQSQG